MTNRLPLLLRDQNILLRPVNIRLEYPGLNMAHQPDISAILAALGKIYQSIFSCRKHLQEDAAAQRPSETSSQAISLPPPNAGYPGIVSAATPSNPSAGIPLPQPSNSGSLDLSQIKPQNSGSVSIGDTVAKSQNFAADKGRFFAKRRP